MIFENNIENVIEFLNNEKTITVSFCMKKWVNKVKRLHEKHPEEVKIIAENQDGSICATLPVKYLKLSPPKRISEEQKLAASKRFKEMHNQRKEEK